MKTMKDRGLWTLLVSTALTVSACDSPIGVEDSKPKVFGSGIVVTETRALASFTAVRASGAFEVVVEQAETEGVEVTADDNLVSFVRTNVIDGMLIVSSDPQVELRPTESIVVRIQAREISTLVAEGVVFLYADIGSVPELTVNVSGVSQVHVTGSAEWQVLHISGVSGYHGLGVESNEVVVTASGVSVAEIWVHERLEVTGSGVSTIRYRGRPSVIANLSGASTVAPVP